MGKIQDAIQKVRRDRAEPASHATPEMHPDPVTSERSVDERNRDYAGSKIAIDHEKLIDAGLLDPDYLRKHLSNEYRQLKKTLLAEITSDGESGEGQRNLIMISSAGNGEGKSFLGLNLAMSMASESDYSIVLVDSSADDPEISQLLGALNESGITDLLADASLDVLNLIAPTDVPGLAFLPAGGNREGMTELSASEQSTAVLADLSAADPRRIFIFDSAPILSSAGARSLAEKMGQILLVVKAGETSQQNLLETLNVLDRERPVSIVLSQVVD